MPRSASNLQTQTHRSFYILVLFLLDMYSEEELLDRIVVIFLIFGEPSTLFSTLAFLFHSLINSAQKISFFPHPFQILWMVFMMVAILIGIWWYPVVLICICQQIWKTQQWPQDWKGSVFIPIPKKGNPKECSNYCTIALISHTSKVMLKILQARLQQYEKCELPVVQAGFRKGKGTSDQIANICWIIKKAREFQTCT